MLKIYYTLPTCEYSDESELCLSEYRRKKLSIVKAPALRSQMIAAELLLNHAVKECFPHMELPLHIVTGSESKPYFEDNPFFFSISHSGRYVACALADYEIGLDLQKLSQVRETIVNRCFSEIEREYLRQSDDVNTAFTEIWCLKESYVKALGTGLKTSFSSFSLSFSEPLSLEGKPETRFWLGGEEGFKLAVCSLNGVIPRPDGICYTELRLP